MKVSPFHQQLREDYRQFIQQGLASQDAQSCLRLDLHCHDANSDVPDELWGRLLGLPETWLKTKDLVQQLQGAGCQALTITNHNNARSCWALMEQGLDILAAAEFTCHFPDGHLSVHVLTYGFTPEQEGRLQRLRHNIYEFLAYTRLHHLPTVLPHPLFFYSKRQKIDPRLLDRLAILFERFEVLNGQRGVWQNQLTRAWVESLTPERLDRLSREQGIALDEFCQHPYRKVMTGGSDDHNGIFAGHCGTQLWVPNLQQVLKDQPASQLALQALREGHCVPYGDPGGSERLTTSFLDYFAQVALNMEDPGLLRLFMHQGPMQDKLLCLGVSNVMQELRRHRYTLTFLHTFHKSLAGKRPKLWTSLGVSREFKPVLKRVKQIARTRRQQPEYLTQCLEESIPGLFTDISRILFARLGEEWARVSTQTKACGSLDQLLSHLEMPTSLRSLFGAERQTPKSMNSVNLLRWMDRLTFPSLAGAVTAGASFAGTQVLYANREFLNQLADELNTHQHPQRVLWLTDSFQGSNGVSAVLKTLLQEVRERHLPIDLLVCDPELNTQAHLQVVRPLQSIPLEPLSDQVLHLPDLLEIQRLFEQGGYDRIVCSTELVMGLVALYLKQAYSVPASFYLHTDWLSYFEQTQPHHRQHLDRLRRLLRLFYQQFDQLLVLNTAQAQWLSSEAMNIPVEKVKLTRHWVNQVFQPLRDQAGKIGLVKDEVLLYVGRLSDEKGVKQLPALFAQIKARFPKAQLWIAGDGPLKAELEAQMPHARFLGWLPISSLVEIYQQASLLVLPSRFDTFGCVVLEALSCGLPVVAYRDKGPQDILQHEICGYLVESEQEMLHACMTYFSCPPLHAAMREAAFQRAQSYQAGEILAKLLSDLGLGQHTSTSMMPIKGMSLEAVSSDGVAALERAVVKVGVAEERAAERL
ncbi:glycosyltransferase [Nitrincola tapanii]|uniref:Glycosyltransferase n=1 Tax=Nitrincola tapanii TaxID=1708751 RepID=A0A5A9W2Z9_9GAMM|nr:glycosyltransferase [Nitrincola tapanii]KAA0875140.1 glycosyltransferase [Nitrincola tapanii]